MITTESKPIPASTLTAHTCGTTEDVNFEVHTQGSAEPAEFNDPEVVHPVSPALATGRTEKDVRDERTVHLMSFVTIPSLQVLLYEVLGTVDASIPNKDQNKAVKHLIRKAFDKTYEEVTRMAYPHDLFDFSCGNAYLLQPRQSRSGALENTLMQK